MKKYNLLLFALLLTFFTVNGQILSTKRVKKSAENKTQQRVDNKVDQGIDKGVRFFWKDGHAPYSQYVGGREVMR